MTMATRTPRQEVARIGRGIGYLIGALVNLALMFVVAHLLDWGFPRFLTGDFARIESLVLFSLGLSVVANVGYAAYDFAELRRAGTIVTNLVSMFVSIRIWQVFPFDYSSYGFNWELVTRAMLGLVIVAVGLDTLVKLGQAGRMAEPSGSVDHS